MKSVSHPLGSGPAARGAAVSTSVAATVHEAYLCGGLDRGFEATDLANLTVQSPSERRWRLGFEAKPDLRLRPHQ